MTVILKFSKKMPPFLSRNLKRKRYVRTRTGSKRRRIGNYAKYTKANRIVTALANRIPRAVSLFPENKVIRHKYVENVQIPAAAAAGLVQFFIVSANGMYDPNITGVGHQPLCYDEAFAKYTYYTVLSSEIKVTFSQNQVTQSNYGVICSQDNALTNIPSELLEQQTHTKPVILSNLSRQLTIKRKYRPSTVWKCSVKDLLADDAHKISGSGNPASKEHAFFHIYASPMIESLQLPVQNIQIEVTYVAMWRGRKDIAQS